VTYEYRCEDGHVTEQFFRSISAGAGVQSVQCNCGKIALRIMSVPLGFGLYGNPAGYYKPSPTKRTSNKVVSGLTGNKNAVG
jgi:hypothetical protein